MDVSVRHSGTGDSCVVGVLEGGTVLRLKADALKEMFPGSINADREAECVAARIEGREDELGDAQRVADTGLEDGGAVKLVPRWPDVKSPAVYSSTHGKEVECITVSRCGTLCSVGFTEGHVTVFGTRTAEVVADLTHGETVIVCTAFSVCGTWLATYSQDSSICVWLTATWEQVWCLEEHDRDPWTAVWTHCGRIVSAVMSGKVRVWDLEGTPSATSLGGDGSVFSIAVSTSTIFTGSGDGSIRVYGIGSLTHTNTLGGHTKGVFSVALTNDEQHLASCSSDMSLKIWCTTTLTCIRTVVVADLPYVLAVSKPRDTVAVSCRDHSKFFSLSTLQYLGKVEMQGVLVALSPCGKFVFTPGDASVIARSVCDALLPEESS